MEEIYIIDNKTFNGNINIEIDMSFNPIRNLQNRYGNKSVISRKKPKPPFRLIWKFDPNMKLSCEQITRVQKYDKHLIVLVMDKCELTVDGKGVCNSWVETYMAREENDYKDMIEYIKNLRLISRQNKLSKI